MDAATEQAALTLVEEALAEPVPAAFVRASTASAAVRSRALMLLSRENSDALRTGGVPSLDEAPPPPERVGAYRVTGLIGQGGMGAVYRGERATGDFDHQVAIKLVRPGALGDELSERFARERQTLARLSHPNIARLLDGGATADGQPYIVMELVDGVPLDHWLATAPPHPARLALFLAICDAVGFAHRNLIVHRDLTPPNVLVTTTGSPKLIDFGIARPLDDSETGASNAAGTMTPGFAAPERFAGGGATTLSDIYSLGRLLERLFPAPRARDLDAIVGMAAAHGPEARYPSADALADDLKRWGAGQPVAARGGGRGYILRRFVGRNRWAVGAAGTALVLLLVAFAATLVANSRAHIARADAERRFAQTRSIARTMLFDGFDAVSRVPGSTRARETLARAGLTYLDALASDANAPFAVRIETGQGYARLADVTGSGAFAGHGRMADSGKLLDRAEAILTAAQRERPDDPAARQALAGFLLERARAALFNDNDISRARAAAEQALALVTPLPGGSPEIAAIRARALTEIGEALSWDDQWGPALAAYRRSGAHVAALPPRLQQHELLLKAAATNSRMTAEALHKLDDEPAARVAIDQAAALFERLLAADPLDPIRRRGVVAAHRYSAILYRANQRQRDAITAIGRATAVARMMRDADLQDESAALLWLLTAEVGAQTLADAGRDADTVALAEAMRAEYRRLIPIAGDVPGMHRHFASALRTIGGNYYNLKAYPRACEAWREGIIHQAWLTTHGELTETDRKRAADFREYLAKACDGGPRAGLEPRI